MAWNPSPEVAVARDAAKKLNGEICVVLYITRSGEVGMASYGRTKELCEVGGQLGDVLFESAMDWAKDNVD